MLKIDDSLDVFAVHGVGGILGTLLVAGLAATGCYEGSELTTFSDARRPIELDNDEMFGELAPAAPPFESEVSEDFSSAEEDPNVEPIECSSPPCFLHEL